MVRVKAKSPEIIERLLSELITVGILPLRASEITEASSGRWEIELTVASFLKPKELNTVIDILLKGGEEA